MANFDVQVLAGDDFDVISGELTRTIVEVVEKGAQGEKGDAIKGDKGDKGEPGFSGFTGTVLGTTDLNSIFTPGMYRQLDSSLATAARNYPKLGFSGVLEVIARDSSVVVQRWTFADATGVVVVYNRLSLNLTTWTQWKAYTSQRVNNPADQPGVEIFTWDDTASIERQVSVVGIDLAGADLNSVTIPGTYKITTGATLAKNYPKPDMAGTLEVSVANVANISQVLTATQGVGSAFPVVWIRRQQGGVWGVWRQLPSARINNQPSGQVGGVELFTWDDVNNIDRQIPITSLILGNINLDTVQAPGQYAQTNGAYITLANNYPVEITTPFVIEVIPMGGWRLQRATMVGSFTASSRGFYQRTYNGTTWTTWKFIASQRVDNTAGRAIYTWDDTANREQLIYGDTGWRDISSLVPKDSPILTGPGELRIRRIGYDIHIEWVGVTLTGGSLSIPDLIPGAWRPLINEQCIGMTSGYQLGNFVVVNSGSVTLRSAGAVNNTTFNLRYPTTAAWPTSLPGVALGGVPNL